MSPKHSKRSKRGYDWSPLLDADKLGLLAALVLSLIMTLIGFFIRDVGFMEMAFRVAIAFAVTWVVAYVAVLLIKWIAMTELARLQPKEPPASETEGEEPPDGAA